MINYSEVIYNYIPTTGFSQQIPDDANVVYLTPAGTLSTGTLTFPKSPQHGQKLKIISSQIITALTMTTTTTQTLIGGASALAANTAVGAWTYFSSLNTWLPV